MEIAINTTKHQELIDITREIADAAQGISKGICIVYVPHATAAIVINENYDPNICTDFFDALNKMIPEHANYRHDRVDGNAAAHIKAGILGPSEAIPVKDGKLILGRWQSVMLCELDGPRERRVIICVVGK